MKRIIPALYIFVFAIILSLSGRISGNASDSLDLPPVKVLSLDNGAKVFFVHDELPQLTIFISIGYGRLYENSQDAGLSDLVAKTISLAGSKHYPGIALHEKIDSIGGVFSVSSSNESTVISLSVLPRFREEAFAIVSDLLRYPVLEEAHFENARSLVIDGIRRRYDDPSNIAFDKTMEVLFGGNGYGAIPTAEKTGSHTLEMARSAVERYFVAKNILIGISSSLPFEEIRGDCVAHFGQLNSGEKADYTVDRSALEKSLAGNRGKIFLHVKDIPQSTVVVGTLAPDIRSRACYPLTLMNFILGEGSFNSRLMREIRVKRGMAYAVASVIRFRRNTGVFLAYAMTKNENATTVLSLLRENITGMGRMKLPEPDLKWAKSSIKNSYIFRFETPMDILGNYLEKDFYGLPDDYYERYLDRINSVSDEQVLRDSGTLFGGGFVTCVVGNEDLKDLLKGQGEVVLVK